MKKWIVRTLALLVFNVVVFLLTGWLCTLLLFGGDVILAGVIAVVVVPSILLQPWSIFFAVTLPFLSVSFIDHSSILILTVPVFTTAISILFWYLLDRAGRLERIKPLAARLKTKKGLAVIACIVFFLCAIGYARHVDFPPLTRTVPPLLEHQLRDTTVKLVHPLCSSEIWLDAEYYVRATVSEHDMQVIADKMQMHAIPASEVPVTFWNQQPYWWRPQRSEKIRMFSTTELPEMEEGSHCEIYAAWNPEDNILYMSIFDF